MLARSFRIVGTALLLLASGSRETASAGDDRLFTFAGAFASRAVMPRPLSATRPASTAVHETGQREQARPPREQPPQSAASAAANAPQVTGSPAASAPFTDDPLVAGNTAVKAAHVSELRTRVDAARTAYGLSPWPWTDPTIVPGVTVVKALHVQELRTALAAVYSAAGRTPPAWSPPTIARGSTVIAAAQIAELRSAVAAVEVSRPTQFGPGQHLVGRDIAPGRYYADPAYGCYWERQRGLSGSLDDIIANDFVGFDSLQVIVDVRSTDLAFQADAECGTWYSTPRQGFQSTIRPGTWLVGSQIRPGTYRATTSDGCYWERLRSFTGELSAIITNDFVSGGGLRSVSIAASDAGFHTDADCGVWTLVSALSPTAQAAGTSGERPRSEVERLRAMNRKQHGMSRIPLT